MPYLEGCLDKNVRFYAPKAEHFRGQCPLGYWLFRDFHRSEVGQDWAPRFLGRGLGECPSGGPFSEVRARAVVSADFCRAGRHAIWEPCNKANAETNELCLKDEF